MVVFHHHTIALKPGDERVDTYNQSAGDSKDANGKGQLVLRPTDRNRGLDRLDNDGDALGRESRAEEEHGGGEYKYDRHAYEHERVPRRIQQGPLGTTENKLSERPNECVGEMKT